MSEMNPEIKQALEMAEAYAQFAPGKLFAKDMECDGDEAYETMILPVESRLRFLFPQLFVLDNESPATVGMRGLTMAAFEAKNAEPFSGSIELRNRPEDLREIHKARWGNYLAKLKPTFLKILTPFQMDLIAECYGYKE